MRLFTLHGAQERALVLVEGAVLDECKVEYGDAPWTWMRWKLRLRDKSRETGEPIICTEWVSYLGTRAEFMKEFREQSSSGTARAPRPGPQVHAQAAGGAHDQLRAQ